LISFSQVIVLLTRVPGSAVPGACGPDKQAAVVSWAG